MIAVIGVSVPLYVQAQQATDLGTVGSTGTADGRAAQAAPPSQAAQVAPTQSSLAATQPKSIIFKTFIEDAKSPVADFSAIAAIAPSMSLGISVNGQGLGETKNTMRGFPDGQFNITWDGIPFGDTNGPTHHSTAYFPAAVIGRIEIERGPGNASNLGQATFGGSLNLFSRELSKQQAFSTTFSYGTWNTQLFAASYDTGNLTQVGDGLLGINIQRMSSDGYRTFSNVSGDNFAVKFQKPLGDSTLLTLNLNYNKNWSYLNDNERGLTQAQADQLGKNFNLGNDPRKANYYLYNKVNKTTAMDYARLQTEWGNGWATDNTFYYYDYTNNGVTSTATDMTTGLGTVRNANGVAIANQMPGGIKTNEFKVYGDIFKAAKQTSAGLVRAGLWAESARTHRSFYDFNLLGAAAMTPNYDQAAVPGVLGPNNNVLYEQKSGWRQYQPFAEFEWQATRDLKMTPGVKQMRTDLFMDATVNQTGRTRQVFTKTFSATLPFLTANYTVAPGWSVYGQYAKGMLVPNIGSFQSANAEATNIDPQTSTNYQAGIVHQSDKLTLDADVYYIPFKNRIAAVPGTPASAPVFINQGGVTYKGMEGQITYTLPAGFSVYANGSINRATVNETGLAIAGVPNNTYALGLLYRSGGWSGTLFHKTVGRIYALEGSAYALDPYSTTDLNVAYKFANPGAGFRSLKLQLGIFNLFNKQDVIAATPANRTVGTAIYGVAAAGDQFQWQPPRSVMASLRAEF